MKVMLLVALLVPLALMGCSTTPSVDEAESAACAAVSAYGQSLRGLSELSPTSTVGEFQAAVAGVETAWEGVSSAIATVQDARVEEVQSAQAELKDAATGIDDDATLAAARADITARVDALIGSIDGLNDTLGCAPAQP